MRFPEAIEDFEVQDPKTLAIPKVNGGLGRRVLYNPERYRMKVNTFVVEWSRRYQQIVRMGVVTPQNTNILRRLTVYWMKLLKGPWIEPWFTAKDCEAIYLGTGDMPTSALLWIRARCNPLVPWSFVTHAQAPAVVRRAVETLVMIGRLAPESVVAALPNELIGCIAQFL